MILVITNSMDGEKVENSRSGFYCNLNQKDVTIL